MHAARKELNAIELIKFRLKVGKGGNEDGRRNYRYAIEELCVFDLGCREVRLCPTILIDFDAVRWLLRLFQRWKGDTGWMRGYLARV